MEDLPFVCSFGTADDHSMCDFLQDMTDTHGLDWELYSGATFTTGTGPSNDTLDKYGMLSHLLTCTSTCTCICV